MQVLFVYLLKVTVYSGILFAYYHIALRNKRFHYYNRFYLLMSVAISLTLPFLQLEIWQWKSTNQQVINLANIMATNSSEQESASHSLSLSFSNFVVLAYSFIIVCLLFSFASGLLKLARLKKKYPSEKVGDVIFINTDLPQAPCSFFKNLFWKNSIDISEETGKQIFRHELTHIEQKHSSDKLFLQLVTLLFWLNPFYWLIQKELSLIHEFIADEKAIDNKDAEAFALMLLQSQFGKTTFLPVQSFSYSPIKRRLHMLTSSSKTSYSYARRILVLPVLSLTVLLFAFKLSNNYQATDFRHTNAPFILVVDAGHGGTDNGAIGISDAEEKGINLSIAKKIEELAPQYGITVKMTRTEDATVSLKDRISFIENAQPDACVSIHINTTEEKLTSKDAFQVFITKNNTGANYQQSRLFGSSLIQSIKTHFPVNADIMQRTQGIYVLDQNPYPAAIVECGYMNNKTSFQQLTSDASMESIAKNILEGVVAYANNEQKTTVTISDTSGKEPLYILDGKEISAAEMKALDANKIESVNVLKGKEATKKYGDKGENGVVLIILKKQLLSSQANVDSNYEIRPRNTEEFIGVYYVDGKEITKAELDKMPKDDIESMSVWKGDEAIKKYGEKGRNGVIEVKAIKGSDKQSAINFSSSAEGSDIYTDPAIIPPSFPGGKDAWLSYLLRNLNADIPVKQGAPTGTYTVVVEFQVDEEGNISNLKAVKDPGFGTGTEAIRMIQRGPKWIPATQNNKPVTTIAKQPITFQVSEGH